MFMLVRLPGNPVITSPLNQLGIWAQHWIELRQEHCDAAYLMQTVHALIRQEQLPRNGVTVRFEFAHEPKVYWPVLEGQQSELCFNDPGSRGGSAGHLR